MPLFDAQAASISSDGSWSKNINNDLIYSSLLDLGQRPSIQYFRLVLTLEFSLKSVYAPI